jgi:hypothetical protein
VETCLISEFIIAAAMKHANTGVNFNDNAFNQYLGCTIYEDIASAIEFLNYNNLQWHTTLTSNKENLFCFVTFIEPPFETTTLLSISNRYNLFQSIPIILKFDISINSYLMHHYKKDVSGLLPKQTQIHPILEEIKNKKAVEILIMFKQSLNKNQHIEIMNNWLKDILNSNESHYSTIHEKIFWTTTKNNETLNHKNFQITKNQTEIITSSNDLSIQIKVGSVFGYKKSKKIMNSIRANWLNWKKLFEKKNYIETCGFHKITFKFRKNSVFIQIPDEMLQYNDINRNNIKNNNNNILNSSSEHNQEPSISAACFSFFASSLAVNGNIIRLALTKPMQLLNNNARAIVQNGFFYLNIFLSFL